MSTTDTPETDKFIQGNGFNPTENMWRDFARKLERERDEMKLSLEGLYEAIGIPVDYEDNTEAIELIQDWQKGHLEREEARSENQRLKEVMEKHLIPVMKLQKPQGIGGWNWPHLVQVAEQALSASPNQVSKPDELVDSALIDMKASYDHMVASRSTTDTPDTSRKIITAHGKEWWAHDGDEQSPCSADLIIRVLFRDGDISQTEDVPGNLRWAWIEKNGDIIAWRPADAPDILPKGGEG